MSKIGLTQKKQKPHERTYLLGRLHWGDCFEFWHTMWYRRRNYPCQILWQWDKGFGSFWYPLFCNSL